MQQQQEQQPQQQLPEGLSTRACVCACVRACREEDELGLLRGRLGPADGSFQEGRTRAAHRRGDDARRRAVDRRHVDVALARRQA